ncbi:carboxypeptidase regulatory-like domain-containing protein [Actinoallomurus sp. NBC_01490]|nr:carboxypeptidase regulatory-like domain-containing protein [Actinoallomurus sp. NBC_01490]
MAFVGIGLGMVMQNLVLSVRNQVRPQELGAASSVVAFFRTLGGAVGAVGVSALGAVLSGRVAHYTAQGLAGIGVHGTGAGGGSIPRLSALPPQIRPIVEDVFGHGIGNVFAYASPFAVLALITVLFIKEAPLRTANTGAAETAAAPVARAAYRPAHAAPHRTPEAAYAVPSRAPETGNVIRGTVRDAAGVPVARAALTLIDADGRQIGRATAGADGRYTLTAPGRGGYVLIASAGEHDPCAVPVDIGDRPARLDVAPAGSGGLAGTVHDAEGAPASRRARRWSSSPTRVARSSRPARPAATAPTPSPGRRPGRTPSRSAPARAGRPRYRSRSATGGPGRTSRCRPPPGCAGSSVPTGAGRSPTPASRCTTPPATWSASPRPARTGRTPSAI